MKENLRTKLITVINLENVICDGIDEEKDYAKVIEQVVDFEAKINLQITFIDTFVKERISACTLNTILFTTIQREIKVKLFILTIKKFSGELCGYQSHTRI